MPRTAHALVALATLALPACGSVPLLEGSDALESARTYAGWEQHEEALELAESVIDEDAAERASPSDEAEASFIAAESALALGMHLRAYRHYRRILENAPWSPHTAVIEDRLYDIGLAFLNDEQYGGWFDSRARGVEALETLHMHYRRSDKADDALRHVGDYFGDEEVREWLEAALTHEQLYRDYPASEWAERSLWLAGHYRLRLVSGPEYNREELLRAQQVLELSLDVHPRGVAARDAAADLAQARDLMARGEVLVADFYAARGNESGERLRLANAALLFPETKAGLGALRRLTEMGLDIEVIAADPTQSSVDTFEVSDGPGGPGR